VRFEPLLYVLSLNRANMRQWNWWNRMINGLSKETRKSTLKLN